VEEIAFSNKASDELEIIRCALRNIFPETSKLFWDISNSAKCNNTIGLFGAILFALCNKAAA
jgi:hypothetical protein